MRWIFYGRRVEWLVALMLLATFAFLGKDVLVEEPAARPFLFGLVAIFSVFFCLLAYIFMRAQRKRARAAIAKVGTVPPSPGGSLPSRSRIYGVLILVTLISISFQLTTGSIRRLFDDSVGSLVGWNLVLLGSVIVLMEAERWFKSRR
jgi:hypothetical protein